MSNTTNMTVSGGVPTRRAIRNAVRDFSSVARNHILDSPDVSPSVKTNISNNDILQWSYNPTVSNSGHFTNVSPADVSILTAPVAKEVFVSSTGVDTNDGSITNSSVLTFQKAVDLAGRAQAFESIAIYVKGDVTYNPSNLRDRLKESSWGGNLSRGVIIRGLNRNVTVPLSASDGPRVITSQLVPGVPFLPDTFTLDPNESLNNVCGRFDLSSTPAEIVPFYRDTSNEFYPVAFDTSTNDGFDPSTRRRVYMADSVALPVTTQQFQPYTFAGKVTLDNNGDITNSGFSMTGNIQFVELEFVLQDGVVTPYHINGEFVILYSKFSKTVGTSGATLSLSSSGNAADHLSTLQIDPVGSQSTGNKVIRVYKSLFEDLTVNFTSPAKIENSVFINCKIINPQNASFDGCTFYNSVGVELGSVDEQISSGNVVSFHNSQFVYGATNTSQFNIKNSAILNLSDILSRPVSQDTNSQNVPLITVNTNSTLFADNLKVTSGVATVGDAVLVKSNNSVVNLSNVSITSTGTIPLVHTENSNVKLHDWSGDVTSNGSLINALQSEISLDIEIVDGLYTVTGSKGVFNFDGCNVKMNDFSFNIDVGITTTTSILTVSNSNVINTTTGKFKCANVVTKNAITVNKSNMRLNNTDTSALNVGSLIANNSNIVLHTVSGTTIIQYNGVGSLLDLNNSTISLERFSLQSNDLSTTIKSVNNSTIHLNNCSITSGGGLGLLGIHLNRSTLKAENISMTFSTITPQTVSNILVENGSSLQVGRVGNLTGIICGLNGVSPLRVDSNSSCSLIETTISAQSPRCIEVSNNSKLYCQGSPSSITSLLAAETIDTSNEVVLVTQNSSATITDMRLYGNSAGLPTGIRATNLSNLYIRGVSAVNIATDNAVVLRWNSKMHATDINVTSTFSDGFYIGTNTYNWNDIKVSPFIIPIGLDLQTTTETTWNSSEGCVATYTN